jgi:hypothetical protein
MNEFLLTERGKFYMNLKEEIQFRNLVRKLIETKIKALKERNQFRKIVLKMILKEAKATAVAPHFSTGINVLKTLLKKVIPIIEADYKQLTTNKFQRDSFRAHVVKGIERTLDREKIPESSEEEITDSDIGLQEQEEENDDEMINFDIGSQDEEEMKTGEPEEEIPSDEDKFIDIEADDEGEKKKSEEEETPETSEEEFGLSGHDETGRNMAFQSYQKIEKDIIRTFSVLSSEEDRDIFQEYLVTNIKMYFDKWEDELSSTVEEPTTSEYERRKDEEEIESDIGLGG